MEITIRVDNLKCGGCASTIKNNLSKLKGISDISVAPEEGTVTFKYAEDQALRKAKEELKRLGYPEAGTLEGINKFTAGVKSYVSCVLGKSPAAKHDKDQEMK